MDFGRVTDLKKLDQIQFTLPPLNDEAEWKQLERVKRAVAKLSESSPQIYVGVPVWADSKWVGQLFPKGTAAENYLKEYAKQFPSVEINSTFYAIPSAETFEKWKQSVSTGFRFFPKFPQTISRPLSSSLDLRDLETFVDRVKILGEKLGACFLQLPPDVGMESIGRLQILFSKIPRELKTMVEFRNPSFFENRRLRPDVVNLLATHHLGTVITDTALYREFAHASLSSTRVMIRFAASDLHPSDYPRLEQWVERLKVWFEAGVQEIFFTVHGHDALAEITVARFLIQKLNEAFKSFKNYQSLAEPVFYHEQQGSLF